MSTQNRTNAGSKAPVSSHPLFSAIVALWFGALFGLGSLAVRVSLIESLIISSHIDVIVPMAAPPLGMTARILIALTMAMFGIGAGAAIARRIARPKKVAPNRRRTAGSVSEASEEEFARQALAQQKELRIAAEKADAVKRRALASGETDPYTSHHDVAPLPGSAPQILDVTQFDLATPGSFETDLPKAQVEEAPLDLAGFDAPQAEFHDPVGLDQVAEPEFAEPTKIEAPAQVIESYGDDTESFRAKFANEKKPVEWTPEPPPGYAATVETTEMADDAPEFVAETAESAETFAPRRFDPVSLEAAVQPQAHTDLELHGFAFAAPSPVSDVVAEIPEEPAVIAAVAAPELRRFEGPAVSAQPAPFASPADFVSPFTAMQTVASEVAAVSAEPEAAPQPQAELPEAEAAPFLPRGNAAERIASANLAELSPVELVERFALALKQRNHTGAFPAGLLATAAAYDLPVRPQPSQVPEILAAMAPQEEPVAASAPETTEIPAAEETPAAVVHAPPPFAATPFASSEIDDAPVAATRLPLTLPAAMRPIEFGQHEEHDDLPDYVPPRSFAMPRLAEVAAAATPPVEASVEAIQHAAAPLAATALEGAAQSPAEVGAEVDVNEEGYSSLLALSRSAPLRQTFVRIDEPTGELGQIEPVVIFPGQATRPGTRFARPTENAVAVEQPAAPMPSLAEVPEAGAPAMRRFDAPVGASPAAAAGAGGVQDPAEAERALRSALATLQRMSGAA